MDLQGGWKIIAECDPETRSRRDLDSESDDEELNSKSLGWPMNENLVPPNAILDPKRLAFLKCDDFLPILEKKSPQRQWISWLSSVKSCSPQKRSRERKERRSRLGKSKSIERGEEEENEGGGTTQDITFITEALVLERERNNASDGMLKGKVVMFGVSHGDNVELKLPNTKSKIYYPREWGCRDKITSFSQDKAKNLAEKLLNPIYKINQRVQVTDKDEKIITSKIKNLIETYHFPTKNSILIFTEHILSLPWKIQYELLKKVQIVLKFDTTNFFTPADQHTKDYKEEYPINLECSMGMETQLTYTQRYPYNEEVLTLYLHHLQKLCSFPESCVPQNLLGIELDKVLQPRLSTLEDAVTSKKESDSYSKIMCKLLESFRISCKADALLLHDVLYINFFKITIYNATQNKVGFYVNYFPDLKLVKNYKIFNKNQESLQNSLGTVTRLIYCYKDNDIKALHKEIFLRKVSECDEIRQCQKYPVNKYFKHKDILNLWNDCSKKNYSLAKFIELSKALHWDDELKWVDETEDLTFNGFLFALLFNNLEGFYPILLSFDEKQQKHEQYIKDVYYSRFYMFKPIADKMKRKNSLYIRNVPATYAELKKNVEVFKYKIRGTRQEKGSKKPRRKLKLALAVKKSHSPAPQPPEKKSPAKKSHSPAPQPAPEKKSPAKKSHSPQPAPEKKSPAKKSPAKKSLEKELQSQTAKKSPAKNTKFLADRKYVQIVANNKECADINQEKDPHELISWKCKPYEEEGGDDTVNQWFAYNTRTSHIISAITDMCLYVDEVKENERVHQGDCEKAHNEWEFKGKNLMLKNTDFALYTAKKGYFIISKKFPRQEYTLRKSPKTNTEYLKGINIPALDV